MGKYKTLSQSLKIAKGYRRRRFSCKDMSKQKSIQQESFKFRDEEMEWLNLTPAQRILETTKLWTFYIALGGRLDPEPDPQSPFYFQEISR